MNGHGNAPFNQDEQVYGDPIAAAEYDDKIFRAWMRQLERCVGRSSDLDILELGPGITLGTQILLAARGNRVTVVDPYPPNWHPVFHPAAYRHLAQISGWATELERAAQCSRLEEICVRQVAQPAEKLDALRDDEFDVVLSNAVLEHVQDPGKVCLELARVTKVGGIHVHQIDLGYHKDRENPLDHLLMSDKAFFAEAEPAHFEYGNRWRATEFAALFKGAGLFVREFHVSDRAKPDYVAGLHSRLKKLRRPYSAWPTEDLAITGLMLVAERRGRGSFLQRVKGQLEIAQQALRKTAVGRLLLN
jgi:SAM-dependent methyltransferase